MLIVESFFFFLTLSNIEYEAFFLKDANSILQSPSYTDTHTNTAGMSSESGFGFFSSPIRGNTDRSAGQNKSNHIWCSII